MNKCAILVAMVRHKHTIEVIKRSGKLELFQLDKLCKSLKEINIQEDLAKQVCEIVSASIKHKISTEEIFKITRDYLHQIDPEVAAIYALERGLSALGPSGFVFEQYVAAIFQEMDYQVDTNVYLEGEGVSHEIDVMAQKGNIVFIVEAKYRNDFKIRTHINQVMYADARLQDIRRQAKKRGDQREYYMWVITNTRFTDNAIHYVAFRDLQLMGWNYPPFLNLMKIVYEKKLYPVTILPSIDKKTLEKMSRKELILVKHFANYDIEKLQEEFLLSRDYATTLYGEIQELILNKSIILENEK